MRSNASAATPVHRSRSRRRVASTAVAGALALTMFGVVVPASSAEAMRPEKCWYKGWFYESGTWYQGWFLEDC